MERYCECFRIDEGGMEGNNDQLRTGVRNGKYKFEDVWFCKEYDNHDWRGRMR